MFELTHPGRIAIIALAAGASRRFGRDDKLLADVGGEPLVARTIRTLARVTVPATLVEIVAVVPDHAGPVARAIAAASGSVRLVENPRRDAGMGTSIAAAMRVIDAANPPWDAALITPCDLPGLTTARIDAMLSAFLARGGDNPVHAALPDGTPVSPMIWPRRLFAALEALDGDRGGRVLLAGEQAEAIRVGSTELFDIDTPDDLARFMERSGVPDNG